MLLLSLVYTISVMSTEGILPGSASTELPPAATTAEMVDRYCITPDGDHRLTWHLAEQDGFSPLAADQFPDLSLPGPGGLRGFEGTVGGRDVRVLTAAFSLSDPEDTRAWFRKCWVSVSDTTIDLADRDMGRLLDVRRFRSKQTLIYAWIPHADGSRRVIGRREFMRRHLRLSREQGLRHVTLRQYGDAVFAGYASPRDRATFRQFDYAGPEPLQAPE